MGLKILRQPLRDVLAKKGENSPTAPCSNFKTGFLTTLTKCSVAQGVSEVKIFFVVYQYGLGW